MRISDDLYTLIKSLTKAEKRFFKLSASIHKGEKNYMKLFDAIDKQREYDEVVLRKIFKNESFIKGFSSEKNYLYHLILKSMNSFHANKSIDSQIKELLRSVNFLADKGLNKQYLKVLSKAKRLAVKYEKHSRILDIIEWERIAMRDKNFTWVSKKELEKDLKKEQLVLRQFKNKIDYHQLIDRFLLLNNKFSTFTRSNKELKSYEAIFSNPILSDENKVLSYDAKRAYYWIHTQYNRIKEDFITAYKYSKKLVELAESQPEIIKEDPGSIITPLTTFIISQFRLKKYKEILNTLNKLKAVSTTSVSFQTRIFLQSYGNELHIYIMTGAFEKGVAILDEVKSGLKRYEENLSMGIKVIFYLNIAYIYFGVENYNNTIEFVNKILNETDRKIREDVQAVTQIFNLIIHFELGNQSILDSLVRSTYRFLYKRKRLYKFETIVLNFIRIKLPKAITQKELLLAFKELKKELEEIIKNPFEKQALEYFDFISWLESKIENRPFAEIVREKA